MRHSKQLIKKIVDMRKSGLTLGEIVYNSGLSKTTIFHHIKSIPKSDILVDKIRAIARAKQKAVADQRRGKSVKNYTFIKPHTWSPDFVTLLTHFLFDGDVSHSACCYNNRNKILIETVKDLMKSLLNVSDYKIYQNPVTGVSKICYFNVEIAAFIKQKSKELMNYISLGSKEEKIAFLRSFFDDEGCVTFEGRKRAVRGYQHSLKILFLVKHLLWDFGVESKISKKYFEIVVSRKNNLIKFQELIGFTPNVRINGNRSNSIWKKDLEKREILRMAVTSYL